MPVAVQIGRMRCHASGAGNASTAATTSGAATPHTVDAPASLPSRLRSSPPAI
uniref:Uncharacterized protein n=1 Tax=Arundo donax TaxID=35708 RepID=A0A0A8ZPH2_ARUDO